MGNVLQIVDIQGAKVGSSDGVELSTAQCVAFLTKILKDDGFSLGKNKAFIYENVQAAYMHAHTQTCLLTKTGSHAPSDEAIKAERVSI